VKWGFFANNRIVSELPTIRDLAISLNSAEHNAA